jgi:ABC-type transport system substrate-binding protein
VILREAFDYEFSRLDPTGPHIDPTHVAVYELLMIKGPDFTARPGLAQSWEISPDGLEWRVKLRPGVRFHSGAPCDAPAVVRPLEHLRWDFPSGQLWYWDPVDSMRAEGSDTVVFRLHYPYVRLPSLLWGTHTTIYNETLRAAEPDRFGFEIADGTGPFRLVSWSPERTVVERFAGYAGGRPRLDGIEWVSILDEQRRLDALERGDVHVIHGPPLREVSRLETDPRFTVVEFPQASTFYLAVDWQRSELGFDDVRVRQALSLALDRPTIVAEALAGRGTPVWGPVPPGDEHYDPAVDHGRSRDVERAIALLRDARGGEPVSCECVVQDDAVFRRVAPLVQAQLAEIGVRLELHYVKPFAPFYSACAEGPPALLSKWLWPDAVDAVIGFASTRCIGFPNWQHSSIPALDAAFDEWLRAGTDDELQAAASRVQHIAAEEVPYVPLVTPNDVWALSVALRGFRPHAADLYPRYTGAWIDANG